MSSAKKDQYKKRPDITAKGSSPKPDVQGSEAVDLALDPSADLQEASTNRHLFTPGSLLGLQRAIGNQAVARLLNAKSGRQTGSGTSDHGANSARQASLVR